MTKYKFITTKINNNQIKYHFTVDNDNQNCWEFDEINYSQFINLLKSEDQEFLRVFRTALNNATDELAAYFWKCPPVSKKTLDKPFEFVVIKSDSLNNIAQNWKPFKEYLAEASILHKLAISFPNNQNPSDAILVSPTLKPESGEKYDYKNISQFTKNASDEQQQELWKEVANKLMEELEKNADVPRWLNTHGLGVHYLHVRIDEKPKYYSDYKEYERFDKNAPIPTPNTNTLKEKILQNLDKICFDPLGCLANAELLKNDEAVLLYNKGIAGSDKPKWKEWETRAFKVEIEGEITDIRDLIAIDYEEIKTTLVNEVKQNPQDWKIVEAIKGSDSGPVIQHKSGRRHWKSIASSREWAKIENALKKSQTPSQQPKSQENDKFPFLAKVSIGGVIFAILIIFIVLLVKRNRKIKSK